MRNKLLSLALALVMCWGLTVPASADAAYNYSANGFTDPSAENVTFSAAPIGVAKIRWVSPWETREYTAYVFDQDCIVTRKDGLPLQYFGLECGHGDVGYSVQMGAFEQWAPTEEEWSWVEAGSAGIRADRDDGWAFSFAPDSSDGELDWSPYMISKKGLDTVFPYEDKEYGVTGTVVEYRPLSTQPAVPAAGSFTDVKEDDYFAQSVQWAVEKNITSGTSKTTFSPKQNCTVAQILTFLYRANGSPKPAGASPFTDVTSGDYFADAAAWAYEKGIVSGAAFAGNTPCTRSMAVTYMWKAAGSPGAKSAGFTDVPAGADYAQAVAWAVEHGITAGTSATTFSPDRICSRGQIVTFLYRVYK